MEAKQRQHRIVTRLTRTQTRNTQQTHTHTHKQTNKQTTCTQLTVDAASGPSQSGAVVIMATPITLPRSKFTQFSKLNVSDVRQMMGLRKNATVHMKLPPSPVILSFCGLSQVIWWGLCEYVIVHTILGGSPVILWISLGGKPKWLPLKFGYHDVMRTSPIGRI